MRDYWRGYLKRCWRFFWAWAMLVNAPAERGGKDGLAAECLFRLNRWAKEENRFVRDDIYRMKNHLVRIFYRKNYCLRAVKATQELECYHTRRYLEGWEPVCPKCDNTGIYASHELYHFTFLVGDTKYIWHQPARLVDWEVKITGAPVVYEGREPECSALEGKQPKMDAAVLYVYLRMAGVKAADLPKQMSLAEAIGGWWWMLKHDTQRRWYQRMRQIERRLEGKQGWVVELVHRLADDGIPF